MGDEKALKKMVEEWAVQDRADLAEGRTRVINYCYACPFGQPVLPVVKEKTGNPKYECKHPATAVPPEPLKVEVGEYGLIPHNCPLKVQPITVFLDPREDV